jgi:hypothetical protein
MLIIVRESRRDNPVTLASLGTQGTGRRQTKQNKKHNIEN